MRYEMPHMGGSTISTRLMAKLIGELRHGIYATCERLPSELEMAEHYGVSRSVVRDVLSDLEREGFVERGRGIGTVVHREIVNMTNRLDLKFEYNELVRGAGFQPGCDNVRVHETTADEKLVRQLHLEKGEAVVVCEKRMLANGKPVIYSIDHMPMHLFASVDYRELDWNRPVFDLLEEHCGIVVDSDVAQVSAVLGPPGIRSLLQCGEGEALLFVDEVGHYKLSRPILQTCGYYTNFFDFTILRKKI